MNLKKAGESLSRINILDLILLSIRKFEDDVAGANVKQVRTLGEYADGMQISSLHPYTEYTIERKEEKGTLTANDPSIVNLSDDNNFLDSIFVDVGYEGVEITSTDSKTNELVKKYSDNIFGLQNGSWELIFNNKIMPDLKIELNEYIENAFR